MRDILFKAKRIDNDEWVEGNLILSDDAEEGWEAIIIPTTDSNMYTKGGARGTVGFENWHRVNKDTICKYTGMTDNNTDDIVFAVKDRDEYYYCGLNVWDKQVRKAKLYRSYKYAKEIRDDIRFIERDTFIVRVRISEMDECCYDD